MDGDALPKRGEAVEDFAAGRSDIPALTRLFYGLSGQNEEFLNRFRSKLKEKDPTFLMGGNDREIAVLSGAELIDVIERSKTQELADFAALALVCSSAHNLRLSPPVPDIPERARAYLSQRAVKRTGDDDASSDALGGAEAVAFLKQQGPHWPKVGNAIERLGSEHRRLSTTVSLLSEECNMLWWLFADWSRDVNARWKELPRAAVPLIAGKEAAELTRVIPGHPAVLAFLDKIVRSAYSKVPATILLKDAVDALPREWRAGFAGARNVPELEALSPVTLAVKLSLTAPGANAWLPFFEQSTGVANASLPPTTLAYQMYQEALLYRAWEPAGGQS